MRTSSFPFGQCGYTLAELLVVCGLIGLLLALAVPAFAGWGDGMRLNNATRLLTADIHLAQEQAQREGKRSRILIDTNRGTYDLQVATTQTASGACTSTEYTSVKHVELGRDLQVGVASPTFACLVFEPTGRTAWSNPKVLKNPFTIPVADAKTGIWTIFLNGVEAPWNTAVVADANVNTWTDPAGGTVTVTLDLGQERFLTTVCPQVIRDGETDKVDFPESIRMDRGTVSGSTPPDNSQWVPVNTVTAPYASAVQSPDGLDWWRACPAFTLNQSVRYIRFVFVPAAQLPPGTSRIMALDEIKVAHPSITLQTLNGQRSQTVNVTPITGRVSLN